MSRINWLYDFALRGCLVGGVLLGVHATSLAQDPNDVVETPAIEAEQNQDAGPQQAAPKLPNSPSESPEPQDAAISGGDTAKDQPTAQESDYYRRNDLIAQQRMADATDRMAELTLWLIGIGAAEMALLLVTITFTAIAARAASQAAKSAADTVGAMRQAERAYVAMSHEPPGLELLDTIRCASFQIEIKNHGRTPATVTDVLLQLDWFDEENPAPDRPSYRIDAPRDKVGYFLVAGGYFFHADILQIPNAREGNDLWLYGFVDYTDEFGAEQRAGYARKYCDARAGRSDEKNNLVFVDKVGWNYDCPRPTDRDNKTKGNQAD